MDGKRGIVIIVIVVGILNVQLGASWPLYVPSYKSTWSASKTFPIIPVTLPPIIIEVEDGCIYNISFHFDRSSTEPWILGERVKIIPPQFFQLWCTLSFLNCFFLHTPGRIRAGDVDFQLHIFSLRSCWSERIHETSTRVWMTIFLFWIHTTNSAQFKRKV